MKSVFWLSTFLLAYAYAGYPALVLLWARLRPRPARRARVEPRVSVLVVARNEGRRIMARLENLRDLEYPRERVEILIASDGSTDDTAARARTFEPRGVRVLAFAGSRGKPARLNALARLARGEILVMADARQRFEPCALRALLAHFDDPRVGAVGGELVLLPRRSGGTVGEGVGFYWRYEKLIRRQEGLIDSTVGATGAIYAIRRSLFEPIPEETLLDDVLIPMQAVRRGYRVLFEPGARALDPAAATAGQELRRKVRTIAGNFQLFARHPWLLSPRRNRLWLQTVSHKGLRLLGPLLFAAVLGTNLCLCRSALYRWTLAGQVLFYAAALGGFALRNAHRRVALLSVPYVICLLNWATLVAFFRFLRGRQGVTWEPASG